MGFAGYLEKKEEAIRLRVLGKSYNEIQKQIKVSKDTLSRWLRDITLTDLQKETLIQKRKKGSIKGSIIGAKKLQKERKTKTLHLYQEGKEAVEPLSKRERFIAGIALYAAEGTKVDRVFEFTNADPSMIAFMVKWLREFGNIDEAKLRGALWLHEGLDDMGAKVYWSRLSGIPVDKMYKTYIVRNKKDSKKIRKNLHQNGVFSIRYLDSTFSRTVIGWISGLFGEAWYNNRISKLHLLQ